MVKDIRDRIHDINKIATCDKESYPNPHIGSIIHNELKRQGRSVIWLADTIHCDRRNIYDIFKRDSIDTSLLIRLSCALKTDFFKYFSDIIGLNKD